jgi:predicted NAD/FAD-binding protein
MSSLPMYLLYFASTQVLGQPVDTGFLVYNEQTYTNLCGLFEVGLSAEDVWGKLNVAVIERCGNRLLCSSFSPQELNVPTEPSDMSFSVSLRGRSFEWSSEGLTGLFATKTNLVSPAFASMLSDMARFNSLSVLGV